MATGQGTATFTGGVGTKSLALGLTATWLEIDIGGSGIRHSFGSVYGGSQFCYPDDTSSVVSGKAIQVKDTSGSVVLEGTWTSFASGNANFNITTAMSPMPQMLLRFGN